ncbi:Shedu anti-phage system protein SduA domain-containing protein [Hydrogenophaga sp. A37]|uniref:Shedu anti-phage system protein SduA domain-containing protein n=1 Tax=Hydrogenophaga sp. A37 TaxID=1945864 RepID=UPI0009C96CFF|nr:Shedu anti-phage system protein SduA domain-containing protein [Hydrogenophaga sp. A37]OOG89029.1 hypothetical protein B0E41_00955 [Hydrogenophaga sp. A37]
MANKANFKVDPKLASLLGEGYRSTEHALKELIDNAWDADATKLTVALPDAMTDSPIIVSDNGSGMTEQELLNEYLVVANDRRSRKGDQTATLKRRVKGRKGIGKFAGLMVAGIMEIETTARGRTTRVVVSKENLMNAARDLERFDLPITVRDAARDAHGTTVTLCELNQRFTFPLPEKLKGLLVVEYGREADFDVKVNGVGLGLDDLQGSSYSHNQAVPDAGAIRLSYKVADSTQVIKQAGIAIRVGGKIVGRPSFFGLEDDPEVPSKLLRKLYGEVEADSLLDGVTADWGDIVENDKAYQAIKPVIQAHIKTALSEVFAKEMNLQRARLQQQLNARLAKLPEYRQRYARLALEKVMKRFYGESEERIETVASVVLDALEKDEYWSILQHINESPGGDIEALAVALTEFGLVDMAQMANQTMSRLQLLDHLDGLVRNPATQEKTIHQIIEKNLWLLGMGYASIASNKTTAKTIQEYTDTKFSGKRASKRPDLFLAQRLSGEYLLIEFKRPSDEITRDNQRQAAEYRDDLEPRFGSIEILLLGKARDATTQPHNDLPRLKVFGYEALVSAARTQLDWLLRQLADA